MNELDSLLQMGLKESLANDLVKSCKKIDNTFQLNNIKVINLFKFDVLSIIYNFYKQMNSIQKKDLEKKINDIFNFEDFKFLSNENKLINNLNYLPYTCSVIEECNLNEKELHEIISNIYTSLFNICTSLIIEDWDNEDSYSNYLMIINAAYFKCLATRLHISKIYEDLLETFYEYDSYDDFIEYLYKINEENIAWDEVLDLDLLDNLIENAEENPYVDCYEENEYLKAYDIFKKIETIYGLQPELASKSSFDYIQAFTNIIIDKKSEICGCNVYFCKKDTIESDRYILVFQNESKFIDLLNEENKWKELENSIYHEDMKTNHNKMVYIVYVIDEDTTSIPIQYIEANKTYGRKYVFTNDESITFINGISNIKLDDSEISNPIHEWTRILDEVDLTGCLTETYFNRNVVGYLNGNPFVSNVLIDEDYDSLTQSEIVPIKWLKSIETKGFRDFCFDKRTFEFGQINLFHGANGSGKTSVLEGIEYALTANIRRIKDFKVKLGYSYYPKVKAYDNEAGIITFDPFYSSKKSKEIEKIWYGVPIGRTKTTLNDNFGKFNSFDSEAAYNFIHNTDSSDASFSQMFGNLLFGENVVGYEKKWLRYKRAFEETYSSIRSELSSARFNKDYYTSLYNSVNKDSVSDELESLIKEMDYSKKYRLQKGSKRYFELKDDLLTLESYVDNLQLLEDNTITFEEVDELIKQSKKQSNTLINQKNILLEKISSYYDDNKNKKELILKYENKCNELKQNIDDYRTAIRNWEIVNRVLAETETINLVNSLTNEKDELDSQLYQINKIELYPEVIKYLNLKNKTRLTNEMINELNTEIIEELNKVNQLKIDYEKLLKSSSSDESNFIELRRLGLELSRNSKCPLCGNDYNDVDTLVNSINNNVLIDDNANKLLNKIDELEKTISLKQDLLEQDNLIVRALEQLTELEKNNDIVKQNSDNMDNILNIVNSKTSLEKRKNAIIEQLSSLATQGFSPTNIQACYQYKSEDSYYLNYLRSDYDDFDLYLNDKLAKLEQSLSLNESHISNYNNIVSNNNSNIEITELEIRNTENKIENLNIKYIRELEQTINTLNECFYLDDDMAVDDWISLFNNLKRSCIYETTRIVNSSYAYEYMSEIEAAEKQIKLLSPQVERCQRAVLTFESMPSLSSFVEKSIKDHISLISKYFKWMHHSGEFTELGVDSTGIYAIRGFNNEVVRTYQMSTGQRTSVAMSVMLALHIAAKNAPKFLLLDEPLATMDDIQVLNVLDIFKALAEQGTQIFFTTANGEMIRHFKECFRNTKFDYKEYEFVKRINEPSLIKEKSINEVPTIEELSYDDLKLDFTQFALIRSSLENNQQMLLSREELEALKMDNNKINIIKQEEQENDDELNLFYSLLTNEEINLLNIIVLNDTATSNEYKRNLAKYPTYHIMFDHINSLAIDYFGESIVENDEDLPWIDDDYIEDLNKEWNEFLMNRKKGD